MATIRLHAPAWTHGRPLRLPRWRWSLTGLLRALAGLLLTLLVLSGAILQAARLAAPERLPRAERALLGPST